VATQVRVLPVPLVEGRDVGVLLEVVTRLVRVRVRVRARARARARVRVRVTVRVTVGVRVLEVVARL
tara:strand:- start:211 stop:411 length:201 start_codon:yes stop_codon:yes gene_type:complete